MTNFKCPICETKITVEDSAPKGQRITCPNCYAQLAIQQVKDKKFLACAICKEAVFEPDNCEECERRRERKKLINDGEL